MNSISKLKSATAAIAVGAVLVLGGTASANAAAPPPGQMAEALDSSAGAQTLQETVTSASCTREVRALQARVAADVPTDFCTNTVVTEASAASLVTATDLLHAKATMSDSEYRSLAAAAASGSVWSKNYSQTISQITDQERQYGKFYYNGIRAWVTVAYAGYDGTHHCVVDYAVGYSISLNYCTDSGSTTQRNLSMSWRFSVAFNGSPISWSESYTIKVNKNGAIWQ